jgi:hypothetical protein
MSEILFVRHAQALANVRDFTAFGNLESPLTEHGIEQAEGLKETFRSEHGIEPDTYDEPVAVSEFTRPQQTAQYAGFRTTEVLPLINESEVDREIIAGVDVIKRHKEQRWTPDETKARAAKLFDLIQSGELSYGIYFTHGMFIASFLLECDERLIETAYPFTEKRGYVPLQASITKLSIQS